MSLLDPSLKHWPRLSTVTHSEKLGFKTFDPDANTLELAGRSIIWPPGRTCHGKESYSEVAWLFVGVCCDNPATRNGGLHSCDPCQWPQKNFLSLAFRSMKRRANPTFACMGMPYWWALRGYIFNYTSHGRKEHPKLSTSMLTERSSVARFVLIVEVSPRWRVQHTAWQPQDSLTLRQALSLASSLELLVPLHDLVGQPLVDIRRALHGASAKRRQRHSVYLRISVRARAHMYCMPSAPKSESMQYNFVCRCSLFS